jgi:Flp pilus assembly protein protease CpaA
MVLFMYLIFTVPFVAVFIVALLVLRRRNRRVTLDEAFPPERIMTRDDKVEDAISCLKTL